MSESYGGGAGGSGPEQPSGMVETAKHEATEVKDTAAEEAGHVVETAKAEAKSVAHEAKSQVNELYTQSRNELKEQAGIQQRRVSEGLRSVGGELRSMADNAENGGIGADLVRQTSLKVSSAAEWIGDRDPGSLLSEVKSYARRKPGIFIAAAALVGLAAGRLTRALAESAADDGPSATGGSSVPGTADQANSSTTSAADSAPVGEASTPLFDQTDAAVRESLREERP